MNDSYCTTAIVFMVITIVALVVGITLISTSAFMGMFPWWYATALMILWILFVYVLSTVFSRWIFH